MTSISKLINNSGDKLSIFGHQSRGLWFDGKNSILDLLSYVFYHTFSIDMWVRPEKGGTLFSAASRSGKSRETLFHVSILDNSIKYEETKNYFFATSDIDSIQVNAW
jgi:hypothetical protein